MCTSIICKHNLLLIIVQKCAKVILRILEIFVDANVNYGEVSSIKSNVII